MKYSAMYLYIFDSKSITLMLGLLLTALSFSIVNGMKKPLSNTARFFLFSFSPVFAVGYLTSALFYPGEISKVDLLACLLLEFLALVFQTFLFIKLKSSVSNGIFISFRFRGWFSFVLTLLLVVNLFILNPWAGSSDRLEYLLVNGFNKYITYFTFIFMCVLAVVAAAQINYHGRLTAFVYYIMSCVLIFSLLSGSKGFFFLFIMQVASLLNFSRYVLTVRRIVIASSVFTTLLIVTGLYISQRNNIDLSEFLSLGFARYFLSNDARAFAFDYRTLSAHPGITELLNHAFGSVAKVLGYPPSDPPLGSLFFQYYYDTASSGGANTSLTALIIYYSQPNQAILSILVFIVILFPVMLLVCFAVAFINNIIAKVAALATLNFCLLLMTQDFLSFQIVMIIFCVMLALLMFKSLLVYAGWRPYEHNNNNNS